MAAFWLALMLTQEQAVEIRVLRRRGLGLRAIARELGCSRTTVKRYLRDEAAGRYAPRPPRPTKLDTHKPYLLERIAAANESNITRGPGGSDLLRRNRRKVGQNSTDVDNYSARIF